MGDKEIAKALTLMAEENRKRDERMAKEYQEREERMVEDQRRRDLRMEELAETARVRDDQLTKILQAMVPPAGRVAAVATPATTSTVVTGALPSFAQFDNAVELWTDYWSRFKTFCEAHLVSEERQAHVFLTNQSTLVYKTLANLSAQQTPPKEINKLTMAEIEEFMADQFNPQRFVVRERYKFWSKMDRKPGESIHDLVARIRGDAGTCDFASIKDPQDEAMRTRFICSINNEAVLKTVFRVKDDELTFAKAIEIAQGAEDAAAAANETVYGNSKAPVFYVGSGEPENVSKIVKDKPPKGRQQQPCDRCGKTGHHRDNCRYRDATCFHCQGRGHFASMCRAKQRGSPPQPSRDQQDVHQISTVKRVGRISRIPPPEEIATKPTNREQLPHRRSDRPTRGKPHGTAMEKQQERQGPLNGDRPRMELPTTSMENLVAKKRVQLTPAKDKTTASGDGVDARKSTFRVVGEPAMSDERRESTNGELSVAGKRRRKRRYRQRRRARTKEAVQWQSALAPSARRTHQASDSLMCLGPDSSARDGSYFGGEESWNAEKAIGHQPLMAATDGVDPRRRGEHAAASERMEFVGFVTAAVKEVVRAEIAAYHRSYDGEAETADVGKKSVGKDDGDSSSPTQMTERQQSDSGTNDGDGSHKGKSAFTSIHCAVRQPPDRVSSVSTFRIAHRDEDGQQPSDGVADKDPGRTTTRDASAQTEEVPSSHVSQPGDDEAPTTATEKDVRAADHRAPTHWFKDRRNWSEELALRGPARQQRRRELEEADPPDITILFG